MKDIVKEVRAFKRPPQQPEPAGAGNPNGPGAPPPGNQGGPRGN